MARRPVQGGDGRLRRVRAPRGHPGPPWATAGSCRCGPHRGPHPRRAAGATWRILCVLLLWGEEGQSRPEPHPRIVSAKSRRSVPFDSNAAGRGGALGLRFHYNLRLPGLTQWRPRPTPPRLAAWPGLAYPDSHQGFQLLILPPCPLLRPSPGRGGHLGAIRHAGGRGGPQCSPRLATWQHLPPSTFPRPGPRQP